MQVIEDGSVLALCSLREKGMKWTMMAAAAISLAALTTPANAALRVLFTGTIDSSSPNPLAGEDGYQNIPLATDTLSVSRSEEHTSELQSLMRISYAVFCFKKQTVKKQNYTSTTTT